MTTTGTAQMRQSTVIVVLTCDHTLVYTRAHMPRADEILYCHRCRDMRAIVTRNAEYHLKCRECRYGRKCGADKDSGTQYARTHHTSKGHIVDLLLQGKVILTVGESPGQTAFPLD